MLVSVIIFNDESGVFMNQAKSIVKQASILAIAGILVRVIGVLYRGPLTALIHDEGNGYYSTAYNIYSLILLLSSYSIPTAISKLISEKLALKQYSNAHRIFICALIYVCVIGGGASLVTFILAPILVTENAVGALKVLCPTIFLSGLLGVFRGYFQAHQTTLYTSISQIIEQIFNAIVSILAAYLIIQPYLEVGGTELAKNGAAGSALGTGAGVLVGIIFMVFMYFRKRRTYEKTLDENEHIESYQSIFRTILSIVTPIILSTCVYNLIATIDMYVFYGILGWKGFTAKQIATQYGIFSGKYLILQNVPVALASAMSAATIPAISSSFALGNKKDAKESIQNSIRVTMFFIIPSAVGMAVLAHPIMGIIFPQKESVMIATNLLRIGSPAIIFYGLSTVTNGVLQALGYVKEPLINSIKALIIHLIVFISILVFTSINVYALVICNIIYCSLVCYLNQRALHQALRFKQEIKRTFLLPLLVSAIMAVVVLIVYYGLFTLTRKVFIPFILAVVIGVVVYFAIMLFMYSDNPEELEQIPYMSYFTSRLKK